MDTRHPVTIQRLDYQPADWLIEHTQLVFELHPANTRVTSQLMIRRRPGAPADAPLVLQGVDCQLESLSADSEVLRKDQYSVNEYELLIDGLPTECVLRIVTLINPEANRALEGLYRSSGNFCTQCEAEGFRKITYYLDRPDVMSVFDVIIEADASEYPVLLSNGNKVSQTTLENNRHRVHWHDPHPKPSYLFALVAGDLACIEDHFTTASGRQVLLQIYVEKHNIERCDFAMQSLVNAMRWDERVYGLEYDLDRFMIVAVDDFNMGAMENKGLNIFNSKFVLADAQTATDSDFMGVEAVIAHEYFHNWTGNRITCRDWFQLSLKEGLTVFRDQCFSSDQHSATVKRIEDVRLLRARQFAEDASPLAHPIRPDSYIEINNFYTLTVYEKGAEVIRMLHTLLGPGNWRRGMDVYIQRHDGTATTCDAFVDAMQSVTELDLTQFRRWYSTAGTPQLQVSEYHDADAAQYHLTLSQYCPDTPGQTNKLPLHIPVVMGLLDADGDALPVSSAGRAHGDSTLIDVTQVQQTFVFEGIENPPVISLLRGFSAPVRLLHAVNDETLAFLLAHDSDDFNRWDAGQRLTQRVIFSLLNGEPQGEVAMELLLEALRAVLLDESIEPAFKAEALSLPSLDTLAGEMSVIDFQSLTSAHDTVARQFAKRCSAALRQRVLDNRSSAFPSMSSAAIGQRRLANTALGLLGMLETGQWESLAHDQYQSANNMTDRLAALATLCHGTGAVRESCLEDFYRSAKGNRLVIDKWFAVQAMARRTSVVDDVLNLTKHPDFDIGNPNRLRSLVATFATVNPTGFYGDNGRGYQFVADQVIALDPVNPQVAARLVSPFGRWRRFNEHHQLLMRKELLRIQSADSLSPDVFELVSKILDD